MRLRICFWRSSSALTLCLLPLTLAAGHIEGTVVITQRLTHPRVTPTADGYQRGAVVELASDREVDWLAYERSHVVIYLDGKLPPLHRSRVAVIEQKNRRFVPDLVVIPAGASVSFPNLDPIFHNVFSLSKPRSFDLGNYPRNQTRIVTFPKPGVVVVGCRLHPNMSAIVFVTPNDWGTTPDADGRFQLAAVPAGRYTVAAWHKRAGYVRRTVEVPAEGTVQVQFTIPLGNPEPGLPSGLRRDQP
jgi:plastocyanin